MTADFFAGMLSGLQYAGLSRNSFDKLSSEIIEFAGSSDDILASDVKLLHAFRGLILELIYG